jgi:DNA invertase Pin-like site-specific DNA recombinase
MNYLIYGRVSTSRQAERELSIPAQIKACQKYGMDHHWNLLPDGIYEEKGESARTTDRPQLQKMLHRAKTNSKVDVILVHKLDRMCRNVADYAAIKMMLKKHDVKVVSVVEQFDESFSGELVENIMASIAQWTSQNISWEVRKGLKEAVERGRFPGVAPLGYLNDKKTKLLMVDNIRAPYVKLAFELYATGKFSYESLAADLNKRGLRTRGGKMVGRKTLEHILANSLYYGLIKTRSATCQAGFPPLITKKLFDDVQEVIQQHNHYADRSCKYLYSMAGFMRCVECGSMLCGQM